jgi:L-asparaginase II
MNTESPVLVEARRGSIVESQHRGSIVVVEPSGKTLFGVGDESFITSTRSTIKPIQAIPFVTSGAVDQFNVTSRELAVACASHQGQSIHTEAVAGLLSRIGLSEASLRCGAHPPFCERTSAKLCAAGEPCNQLHNNCSGKHAGMLATSIHKGYSLDDYLSPTHPVQKEILRTLMTFSGLDIEPPVAIDGCSAPTFGLPLRSLATAFARLVNPWNGSDIAIEDSQKEACKRIVAAMTSHPEMVGGTGGRFDTELMRVAQGKLICKVGAEAAYVIGILPSGRFRRGAGIAIKIDDGSRRALYPAIVETLVQLGILDQKQQARLSSFHREPVTNHSGQIVGELKAVFKLQVPVSNQITA